MGLLLFGAIVGARFYDLTRRNVHHDEGVNGWFIQRILDNPQDFHYTPEHYHGPTLFKFGAFLSHTLKKHNIFTMRLIPVIFSLLLCLTPLLLWRFIHPAGLLAMMFFLSFSSTNLFYARYAIHEMMLLWGVSVFALCLLRFHLTKKLAYWLFAFFMLSFAAATKETVVLHLVAICAALFLAWVFAAHKFSPLPECLKGFREELRQTDWFGWTIRVLWAVIVFLAGLYLWFKTHEVRQFFASYLFYFDLSKTNETGHNKEFTYFLKFLWKTEWPIVLMALMGAQVAWQKRQ